MIYLTNDACNNIITNGWLIKYLVCPRDHSDLTLKNNILQCEMGHKYPIVEGIPIMLLHDVSITHDQCYKSLKQANESINDQIKNDLITDNRVDKFVQRNVAATCGLLYRPIINRLTEYPIPVLPPILPETSGQYFLDIGANWGRWCIGAAKKGYFPIGIDPNLDAIKAAVRVAKTLGIKGAFVVGDARYLPFPDKCIDVAFSFSVLHHFKKDDTKLALKEISRILKTNGTSLIQLSNSFGLHNLIINIRRKFIRKTIFDIQYYSYKELKDMFNTLIGPTILIPHAYFSTGALICDLKYLPFKYRLLVRTSELMVKISAKLLIIKIIADSFYIKSICK